MAPKTAAPAVEQKKFVGLPLEVVGPIDLGRLIREVEAVDNYMLQQELRNEGGATQLPKLSHLLDKTVDVNHVDLRSPAERKELLKFVELIREQAPVLHMSFSADPSPLFTEKVLSWLRKEIHPLVLLTVGLQPNLGAGCIVRTTNKYFDFSLRQDLMRKSDILAASLRELNTA